MAVELVVVAPLLVMVMLLIVGFGRLAMARHQVTGAAADAARAAVLNLANPRHAARAAAADSLGDRGVACASMSTTVTPAGPGGTVAVSVSCTARLSDVAVLGMPGTRTLTATARAPVEHHRGQP